MRRLLYSVALLWAVSLAGQIPAVPTKLRVVNGLPTLTLRGPQPTITCPSGAVRIAPGANIQAVINANPAGTTYCLQAGSYTPTAPIRPKTGDTLQGEYGAVINGQNVQGGEGSGISVISGWNCSSCENITVRNLSIRGRETINCIGAAGLKSGGWVVEYNDIRDCRWGVNDHNPWATQLPQIFIRGWKIRHNVLVNHKWSGATGSDGSGAYGIVNADDVEFINNEVRDSGGQPKFMATRRSVVRGNWLHHNGVGIWHDGDNVDALIEDNLVEDNEGEGIFHEISAGGTIRNNIIRRNGFAPITGSGIYISTSRDVQIFGNTVEENFRDINLFVQCAAVRPAGFFYPTQIEWDLRNVSVHDNAIKVGGPEFTVWGPSFSSTGCTAEELARYAAPHNVKNNRFQDNTYTVRSAGGMWWFWNGFKTFSAWQALGQDTTGGVSQ